MKQSKILTCFLLTGWCLMGAISAQAAGKVIIQPYVEVGFKNEDNFWKSADNEVSVNTYSLSPGLLLGMETPKLSANLDGSINIYWYDDQDTPPAGIGDASDDDYTGVSLLGSIYYQLTDLVNLGVSDQFLVTRDPASSDEFSDSVSREKYTINTFEPTIYYAISKKYGARASYRNIITEYEEESEDSVEHRGIFDLYYYLNEGASVYLDYSIWERDYDEDSSDYTTNFVSLNYQHEFNFLSLITGGGYYNRSFDESGLDDIDFFSWNLGLEGMDQETDRTTTQKYVNLKLGQTLNDAGSGDSYYTVSFINFEGAYKFIPKLEGIFYAGFQNSDYETEDREDDIVKLSGGINYTPLDYLILSLEVGNEDRDSNIDGNDFDNTFVMLTLNINYDLGSR